MNSRTCYHFGLMLIVILTLPIHLSAQSYNYHAYNTIRIAYLQNIVGRSIDNFFYDAQKYKYNYVVAPFYFDWYGGSFEEMEAALTQAFRKTDAYGLRFIPLIQMGGYHGLHWRAVRDNVNRSITMNWLRTNEGFEEVGVIVKPDGGVEPKLKPSIKNYGSPAIAYEEHGIDKSFVDFLHHVKRAYEASGVSYPFEFMHLGHDEVTNHRVNIIARRGEGRSKTGIEWWFKDYSSTDYDAIAHLKKNSLSTEQAYRRLYVSEIYRRLTQVQSVLGSNMKVLIWADAWDPQSYGYLSWDSEFGEGTWKDGLLKLPGLAEDFSDPHAPQKFKDNVFLMPWNYDGKRPKAVLQDQFFPDRRPDYNTEDTFYKFHANGFKFIWTHAFSKPHINSDPEDHQKNLRKQAKEYYDTCTKFTGNCLGYCAATWEDWDDNAVSGAFTVMQHLHDLNKESIPARSFINPVLPISALDISPFR